MAFFYAFLCIFITPLFWHKITYALSKLRSIKNKPKLQLANLQYFLKEHHLMVIDILRGTDELWDRVWTILLLTNLLPNVLICTKLAFGELSQIDSLLFWTVLGGQMLGAVSTLLPLSSSAKALHRPAHHLVAVQATLGQPFLWYKLKLDDLFLRLTHGQMYSITVQPLGAITYHSVAQVRGEREKNRFQV